MRRTTIKKGFALLFSLMVVVGIAASTTANSSSSSNPVSLPVPGNSTVALEPEDSPWLGTWNASMTPAGEAGTVSGDGFTDVTLRQSAHVSIGGESLRVRVSNVYGEKPLEIGSMTVASGTPVTFDGERTATVPAGEELASDPVEDMVEPGTDLVVSMYLPGPTGPATTHPVGRSTSLLAEGDQTEADDSAFSALDESRYFLSGIDVISDAKHSVVFFGDSITDGYSSTVDANMRYPDQVAARLLERPTDQQCGVVNSGISGNELLTHAGTRGDAGVTRFDRDVLARPGVDTVVLLEGINDIGFSDGAVRAEDLIAAYQNLIDRAHSYDLQVIGATLTPDTGANYFTDAGERTRQEVNEWIRSSGAFDGVLDFDTVVQDPENPEQLNPAYNPGDNLHPNDDGYSAMAEGVDLDAIC